MLWNLRLELEVELGAKTEAITVLSWWTGGPHIFDRRIIGRASVSCEIKKSIL